MMYEQEQQAESRQERLDRLLLCPRYGMPLMGLLLVGIIWLTVWGANYPGQWLETLFDIGYAAFSRLFSRMPGWLSGILLDGVYATCARVISVTLPPMAIFFPLFTLLEESGYLPRMALLLDPFMARCGCCGNQALTMCMGLGCNAVGVMGCRIIHSPTQRISAMLTNAMIPCNGRFPTLILLGSLFFPEAGAALAVAFCVALGAVMAAAVSGLLNRHYFRCVSGDCSFQLPPLRRPRLGQVLFHSLVDNTLVTAGRALVMAAPAGALLWLLSNTSALGATADFLQPAGVILGMNGLILTAFILSLPANELLIPVILMGLTGSSLVSAGGIGSQLLLESIGWQTAVCTMVFTVFHWPCSTTLLTLYRETGSLKKTTAAFLLPTVVGCILCAGLNLILQYFR